MQTASAKQIRDIFITFFKIGLFTFGGGYAMIPLIEREVIEKRKWMESGEIADVFSISQSIPGAVAINTATLTGYKISGRKGALTATLGVILPSFFTILLIAVFFSRFNEYPLVVAAFRGINAVVAALIFVAAVSVGKNSVRDKAGLLIAIAAATVVGVLQINAVWAIAGGAVLGVLTSVIQSGRIKRLAEKAGKHDDLS